MYCIILRYELKITANIKNVFSNIEFFDVASKLSCIFSMV